MSVASRYLDAATVEQLNHLQLSARSIVEGSAIGLHRSRLNGASVEFRQHRPYVPGDETRRLDWRILARTDRPFVKEYDQETNLRCLFILDSSGSMAYGSNAGDGKFEFASRLVAALSYLMLAVTESVGLVTTDGPDQRWLAPQSGSQQLSRVINTLNVIAPSGAAGLAHTSAYAASRLGRRALVILISDFFSPINEIQDALARLRHDRHELICLRVLHRDEVTFPFKKWSLFRGLEDERPQLNETAFVRESYLKNFEKHRQNLDTLCRSINTALFIATSDQSVADTVKKLIESRLKR